VSTDLAPNPYSPVTTLRTVCSHGPSECIPVDFPITVSEAVIQFSTEIVRTGGKHMRGGIFNEDGETPFAVLYDFEGGAIVVWEFDMTETQFGSGLLKFAKHMTCRMWAEFNLRYMVDELKETGLQVLGFDENGPFPV